MTDSWTQDPQVRDDPALRAYLDTLASTAQEPVDPAVRAATLQDVLAEAARTPRPAPAPAWCRRTRRVLGLTGVKVVLASGMAVAATGGGLAATGTLPDPVQAFVHEVGSRVGLPFPSPAGRAADADGDAGGTGRHWPRQTGRGDADGRDVPPGPQQGQDVTAPGGRLEEVPAHPAPGRGRGPDPLPHVPTRRDGRPGGGPAGEAPAPPPEQPSGDDADAPVRSDRSGRPGDAPVSDDGPPGQASAEASDGTGAPGPDSSPGQRGGPTGRG